MAAIEQIKAAVKKFRAEMPTAAEGEKCPSLGQTNNQVAKAKGFSCWDALVAVVTRQSGPGVQLSAAVKPHREP